MSPSSRPPAPPAEARVVRAQTARALLRELRELGSRSSSPQTLQSLQTLQLGSDREVRAREQSTRRLPTGLLQIDRLVEGGFPAGRLSEIHGPHSSGRTSVALGLLAQATRAGEVAAVVDPARTFDPTSAQNAGADLERLLWVHPQNTAQAARCCQQILEAGGFSLVLWDLAQAPEPSLPIASWQKLCRATLGGTALVALASRRMTGTQADLVLEMQTPRPHFSGPPELLEGLEIEAVVVRHRTGPDQRAASVRLHTRGAA